MILFFFSLHPNGSGRRGTVLTRRRGTPEETASAAEAFDFQRDADISTFHSLDQPRPFRSFTFHVESWAPGKEMMEGYSIFKCIQALTSSRSIRIRYEYWKCRLVSGGVPFRDDDCLRPHCNLASIWGKMKRPLHPQHQSAGLFLTFLIKAPLRPRKVRAR